MERIEIDPKKKLRVLADLVSSCDCLRLDYVKMFVSVVQDVEPKIEYQLPYLLDLQNHRGHQTPDTRDFIDDCITKLKAEIKSDPSKP